MGDNMKKILCIIVLLFIIMCTSSCVTVHKKFERVEDVANIESVEVYFIDWEEELFLQDIPESMQPIEILDKSVYEGLIQDLESFVLNQYCLFLLQTIQVGIFMDSCLKLYIHPVLIKLYQTVVQFIPIIQKNNLKHFMVQYLKKPGMNLLKSI